MAKWLNKGENHYKAYVSHKNFLPPLNSINNQSIIKATALGIYISINIIDTEYDELKKHLSAITANQAPIQINNVAEKVHAYTSNIAEFIRPLLVSNECTNYFIHLCNLNSEKLKMHPPLHVNSDGIIINTFQILLNCFFIGSYDGESILEKLIFINTDFFKISEFKNFEKINRESKVEEIDCKNNFSQYLPETKCFVFCHILLREALEGLNKLNHQLINQAQTVGSNPNSPEFKKVVTHLHSLYSIFKCKHFSKRLINFLEITVYLCFTRNNTKYSLNNFLKEGISYFKNFFQDFYYFIEDKESESFNSLPELVISNVTKTIKFLRESNQEIFIKNMNASKAFVYFSLIYSSKTNIIKNPYIRAETLDIVEYFFIQDNGNKKEQNKLIRIFDDNLVKEIFIYSLVRVFIDSERLGGSNQFYEKFNVRYKILLLIDSVKNQISIDDQLIFYAKKFKDDCILLVNYLINDLTYMADETLERLKSIKSYEELKSNTEKYQSLEEEKRKQLDEKFNEDSSRAKNCIPLFKSYLQFTITISNTCQDIILEYKLGQKLANLINYLLDMFASKSGNTLKVSNFSQYKFNPKEILSYIIQAYSAFSEHKEFWTFIISDERCFKFDNFTRALNLRSKVSLNYEIGEKFLKLVNGINSIKENITSNIIDYEDAPDEYLDPITAELMEDPVMLPFSKQIVDRFTIEQHLLSDPKDPFSRSPLTKSELIELPELKQKIKNYNVKQREI